MENKTEKMPSDAEWYCQKDSEEERFYVPKVRREMGNCRRKRAAVY